jgi:hypothetical protein
MPRVPRIEYEKAWYHVMCRRDRREDIFLEDEDRECFWKPDGAPGARSEEMEKGFARMHGLNSPPPRTKNALSIFLLLLLVAGAGAFWTVRNQTIDTELRRKRNADAYAIRNSLVLFMHEHNGVLPSTLTELRFERSDIDPSPFSLFDPEIRKGQLGKGVIAEAEPGGNGKHRIVVYADGTVRYE